MMNKHKILALIPARGGSKRVPGKNIKNLSGKELIAYTIGHAQQSKFINRIIVTTDDDKTAMISKKYGVEVPFLRPTQLSQDDTLDLPVFEHALEWLREKENYIPDIVVHLRPTSPLRNVADVDAAIEILLEHPEADSVRTVVEARPSPYKMYIIGESKYLEPIVAIPGVKEGYNFPDQELPMAYRHIGTADVIWTRTITEKHEMSGSRILPYIVSQAYTGINTQEDWEYYEFLMSKKNI